MDEQLVQNAVSTFCAVPEVYQQIFQQMGADFPDELVQAVKSQPEESMQMIQKNENLLQGIVTVYQQYGDEINKAASKVTGMFKKGGKLDQLVKKSQKGGWLDKAAAKNKELYKTDSGFRKKADEEAAKYKKTGETDKKKSEDKKKSQKENWLDRAAAKDKERYETDSKFRKKVDAANPGKFDTGGPLESSEYLRQRGIVPAHTGDAKYPSGDGTRMNGAEIQNVYNGHTLTQHVVTEGDYGTPRRVQRVITNYDMPAKSDTVYIDAMGNKGRRNPNFLERLFGNTHKPEFMDSGDARLEGADPIQFSEREVKATSLKRK